MVKSLIGAAAIFTICGLYASSEQNMPKYRVLDKSSRFVGESHKIVLFPGDKSENTAALYHNKRWYRGCYDRLEKSLELIGWSVPGGSLETAADKNLKPNSCGKRARCACETYEDFTQLVKHNFSNKRLKLTHWRLTKSAGLLLAPSVVVFVLWAIAVLVSQGYKKRDLDVFAQRIRGTVDNYVRMHKRDDLIPLRLSSNVESNVRLLRQFLSTKDFPEPLRDLALQYIDRAEKSTAVSKKKLVPGFIGAACLGVILSTACYMLYNRKKIIACDEQLCQTLDKASTIATASGA